ncbi:hypothetical protein H2200_012565 [Cladophialophora chaetospira]|uniref:Uncharacterized protein n=1 Tax=Cladophialophora chaetospira TaxID=386627 RepID=A0AA38WX53_9EURO|nr:hypothetical protein H2200_012565 [Cladophialophora chaetospira]
MAFSTPHEACLRLADDLEQHWSADEALNKSHKDMIATLKTVGNDTSDDLSKIWTLMPVLSHHMWEIFQTGKPEEFKTAILGTLADATREVPFWRPLFGLVDMPDYAYNLKHRKPDIPPDSILELARRIIAGLIKVSSSQQLRSALRIIANCCADNNINRSIMINRDGIEDLLEEVLRKGRECDLAIPVLYNICIDYDEPALDGYRRPWISSPEPRVIDSAEVTLNDAEQRLGTYWFLYEDKTSFEILLDARHHAENCAGTIADLIEIGSRVALFGVDQFVQENGGRDPDEVGEVDTTARIVHLIFTKGIELAQFDTDCRLSMCQALLNFLSQAEIQTIVINTEDALWNLIHLPYPEDYDSLPDEEKASLQIYQKAFLKIIYETSAADDFAVKMTDQSSFIQNCLSALDSYSHGTTLSAFDNGLLASIYVLVANSITTKERAQSLLRSSDIASSLRLQFPRLSDPEVLLPAIGVATRLVLCPEGQDALQDMLHHVTRVLHPTASKVDASRTEIQRNACILMRLLIKGRTSSIQRPSHQPCNPSSPSPVESGAQTSPTFTMTEALSIFHRTQDDQTKLEIGRLSIEILRLLATLKTDSVQTSLVGQNLDKQTAPSFKEGEETLNRIFRPQSPLSPVSAAETISYILTQPQSQDPSSHQQQPGLQVEGEAWFGLGLLSAYPSAHASIRAALAANGYHLLNRLHEILASSSSSPSASSAEPNIAHVDAGTLQGKDEAAREGSAQQRDPRLENIKFLIVRLTQTQTQTQRQASLARDLTSLTVDESNRPDLQSIDKETDKKVQSSLEAAAAEMGLDWVIVSR